MYLQKIKILQTHSKNSKFWFLDSNKILELEE